MNGKVKKQMTKCVDGKQTVIVCCVCCAFGLNTVQNIKWTNEPSWMERIWHVHIVDMNCRLGEKCSCQPHRGNGKNSRGGFALISLALNHKTEANTAGSATPHNPMMCNKVTQI